MMPLFMAGWLMVMGMLSVWRLLNVCAGATLARWSFATPLREPVM